MAAVELDFKAVMERSGELVRYWVAGGERVLVAHPVSGGAEILDLPVSGRGACYRVDRVSGGGPALEALVGEYVRQARRLGRCPMSPRALESIVGLSEDGLAGALADSIDGAGG